MTKRFYIADPHYGHKNICTFYNYDGTKTRPWDNVDEMNEAMIDNWNKVVGDYDKVYMLGDIVINREALSILNRLKGKKILIKGNHDIFELSDYAPFFEDICGYHIIDGMILSHIPIHPESLGGLGVNVHGHLHSNRVRKPIGIDSNTCEIIYGNEIDPRYFCVSVEQINYTPIEHDELVFRIVAQGGSIEPKPKINT
jgi:calcineurin-like phosphoesterase family protein